ncbi:MAG: NAD(P)H-binding protein [Pseudomonadota bacterium]
MSRGTLAITGATGFVGQTLVRLAIDDGWHVRALTRTPKAPKAGLSWINGSLEQPASLDELAQGSDAVIHVAGVVNTLDRAGFAKGNIDGTHAVVRAAQKAGCRRFIHVSSLSAREPALSNYGWSKSEAETVVANSTLDWTMVRPPAIYGPGDKDMLDLFKMAQHGFVLLPPTGQISVIEVSDLARLLIKLAEKPDTTSQIFETDDGRAGGWSHVEFGKAIGAAVGKQIVTLSMPRGLVRVGAKLDSLIRGNKAKLTDDRAAYFCHTDWVISAAARVPPQIWQPQIETTAGLRNTARAYHAAGWL